MTADPRAPGDAQTTQPAEATGAADAIRAAVLDVPGVAGLHAGTFGEVATHLPGRSVPGVQVRPERTAVYVVLEWDVRARETATLVRAAVAGITHAPVDVVIADIAAPGEAPPRQVL